MNNQELPKAIDLSHHLSDVAKSRATSPLKGLQKYFDRPNILSLAGGLPSPAYFPISTLSAEALLQDSFAVAPPERSSFSWFWKLLGADPSPKEKTEHISIPKYGETPEDLCLARALQYGPAVGLPQLQEFMREFSLKVFQPQYSDFMTLVHTGNTDGWARVVETLCNRGELFLTEEWTYPSALSAAQPLGVFPTPVKMDGEGMSSVNLRKVLAEWDEAERGAKRPHVMYTVPVGQNPTGQTMGASRKKEIYDICVEYDVIIVEDDPYYFLQHGTYFPKSSRRFPKAAKADDEEAVFIASLAPSFVKFDYQGRVIRMDSFSKTIAPGSRLGWFTCQPVFAERLERQGETTTQSPCGFGQSIVAELVTKRWGFAGYVRWLRGLRTEYAMRRDFFVDCLADAFDLQPTIMTAGEWDGCTAYVARAKLATGREGALDEKRVFGRKVLFSFIPPTSGMFVWVKIAFENHRSYASEDKARLEDKLWIALAEANLLIAPGILFTTDRDAYPDASAHMRIAFSTADQQDMKKAVTILDKVLREFFDE